MVRAQPCHSLSIYLCGLSSSCVPHRGMDGWMDGCKYVAPTKGESHYYCLSPTSFQSPATWERPHRKRSPIRHPSICVQVYLVHPSTEWLSLRTVVTPASDPFTLSPLSRITRFFLSSTGVWKKTAYFLYLIVYYKVPKQGYLESRW